VLMLQHMRSNGRYVAGRSKCLKQAPVSPACRDDENVLRRNQGVGVITCARGEAVWKRHARGRQDERGVLQQPAAIQAQRLCSRHRSVQPRQAHAQGRHSLCAMRAHLTGIAGSQLCSADMLLSLVVSGSQRNTRHIRCQADN
jgi:hypothetical protein